MGMFLDKEAGHLVLTGLPNSFVRLHLLEKCRGLFRLTYYLRSKRGAEGKVRKSKKEKKRKLEGRRRKL